jgi:hypothetical protein
VVFPEEDEDVLGTVARYALVVSFPDSLSSVTDSSFLGATPSPCLSRDKALLDSMVDRETHRKTRFLPSLKAGSWRAAVFATSAMIADCE